MKNLILCISLIASASMVNMSTALADSTSIKYLECHINKVSDPSSNPADILEIILNLEDGSKTKINDIKVQAVTPTEIANYFRMAQIVKWNSQQVSISLDFNNVYIKDVASYICN